MENTNTNRIELREILGVYEHGEAAGTRRGLKTGLTVGAMCVLVIAGLLLAVLCGTGRVRFIPAESMTGPVGDPRDAAPGLPPGVVPPLTTVSVPPASTAAPALKSAPVGVPPAPSVAGLPPAPTPDAQTIRPAPPGDLPRPVRLPSD